MPVISIKNKTPTKTFLNQTQPSGPITRAQAKLIKYKDTAQLALMLLQDEKPSININSLCDPSEHCAECEGKEEYFQIKNMLQAK